MKNHLICIISDNNIEYVKKAIPEIQHVDDADLLIIDDGSEYNIIDEIGDYKFVKCIMHEMPLGYGTCIDAAMVFARDMEYKYLITLDPSTQGMLKDASIIIENLKYGYDIVSCSRILENFNHDSINSELLEVYEIISSEINSVVELNLTDPLSPNKGYSIHSFQEFELTESGHGALFQVFIQGSYFGYSIMEVPSEADLPLGSELVEYENPLVDFHTIIEAEKYLYNKGSVN